jgi:hypothetical protein
MLQPTTIDIIEKKAKAEAAANPDRLVVVPLRAIGGGAKAMERRETMKLPITHEDGSSETQTIMDWSIEVFTPSDKQFTIELVHFNDLTVPQYLEDKDFLEQIVQSLRYDAAGGALQ